MVRFVRLLRIYLLSNQRKAAFSLTFTNRKALILGPNGAGKSTLIRAVLSAFGARQSAFRPGTRDVFLETLVEFEVGHKQYAVYRNEKSWRLFQLEERGPYEIFASSNGVEDFLRELFSFDLSYVDPAKEQAEPAPISHFFLPSYIDQDLGWRGYLSSFGSLSSLQREALVKYMAGVLSDEVVGKQIELLTARKCLREIEGERRSIDSARRSLASSRTTPHEVLGSDEVFSAFASSMIDRLKTATDKKIRLTKKLTEKKQELSLWHEQISLITASIRELRGLGQSAIRRPFTVSCPLCGQDHHNSLVERFGFVEDISVLASSRQRADQMALMLQESIREIETNLHQLDEEFHDARRYLNLGPEDVTLENFVQARSYHVSDQKLLELMDQKDDEIYINRQIIERINDELGESIHETSFHADWEKTFLYFANILGVTPKSAVPPRYDQKLLSSGSERAREIISYRYTLLKIATGSERTLPPIIIDSANSSGQDNHNRLKVILFLFDNVPNEAQIIVSAEEERLDLEGRDIQIVYLNSNDSRLLSEDDYLGVRDRIDRYIFPLFR